MVRNAGRLLGEVLAGAVNFFNPSVIVLGGDLAEAHEQLFAGVREVVYRRSTTLATRHLQIVRSRLGVHAGVVGCAVTVLQHILSPEAVDPRLALSDRMGEVGGVDVRTAARVSTTAPVGAPSTSLGHSRGETAGPLALPKQRRKLLKRLTKTGALVLALAAITAACGSSSKGTSATSASSVATGGSTSAAAGAGNYVIGVSNTLAGNGWREEMICAVKAQALASGRVSKVIAISKNGGPTEQIQDLQNLISQGVNAIIVNPSDREKLNPVIEDAAKKGIVVVAVDQAVTAPSAYVATNDQVAYGRLGAQYLADALGGKGNVLYMPRHRRRARRRRPRQGLQGSHGEVPRHQAKEVFSGWDFTKGGDEAVQELTAADYDGIWTSGIDYTVVNAFTTAARSPVPVVGADNNEFLNQLLQGQPGAAVTNPAGHRWSGRGYRHRRARRQEPAEAERC